jgi:hypothetical protein
MSNYALLVEITSVTRESAEELDNVIARCFDAAMRQPGLRIKYTLGIDGERTISVENIETYRIPAAADIESYIIAEARRGIQQPKPGQSAIELPPPTVKGVAAEMPLPSAANPENWTSEEYSALTATLTDLPDDVELPVRIDGMEGKSR